MGGGDHDFLAPSSLPVEPASQRMTNADFRKLMMTPRAGQTPAPPTPGGGVTPGGGAMAGGRTGGATPRSGRMDKGKAEERRKKKTYYAKLKKDEDDKMAELAEKYRDRARERRDGGEGVVGEESTNAYRAVAPNARENHDAAERRRQMIHESKYLGGDMEHTHLVKGLDFALLQKVKSEIETREQMEEEEEEEENEKEVEKKVESKKESQLRGEEPEDEKPEVECRTVMGKNIMRLMFKPEGPKVNELFKPGRMAYVMDLEDEGETDIPTTSIRSKQDVINNEQKATLSTNDIVINKLTQILSYLRAGNRTKKKKKDRMGDLLGVEEDAGKANSGTGGKDMDLPIYDDVGDYKPKKDDKRDRRDDRRDKDRDRGRDGDRRRDDKRDRDRDRHREGRDRDRERWDRGDERNKKDSDGGSKKQNYFDKHEEPREKEQRGFSAEDKVGKAEDYKLFDILYSQETIKALMKKEEEKEKQKDDKKLAGMMQSSSHDG